MPDPLLDAVAAATARRAALIAETQAATAAWYDAIKAASRAGRVHRAIAERADVTRDRIHQIARLPDAARGSAEAPQHVR